MIKILKYNFVYRLFLELIELTKLYFKKYRVVEKLRNDSNIHLKVPYIKYFAVQKRYSFVWVTEKTFFDDEKELAINYCKSLSDNSNQNKQKEYTKVIHIND